MDRLPQQRSTQRHERVDAAGGRPVSDTRGSLLPEGLLNVPWHLAPALRDADWWLRPELLWHEPNADLGAASDRQTKTISGTFGLTAGMAE